MKAPELPQRFVTLFFDDVHLSIADSMYSQLAAAKVLGSMQEGDRFAIFTTSGAVNRISQRTGRSWTGRSRES